MKIGFLTPEYPHPRFGPSGGIGTSISNLSAGLLQAGHQVIVLIYGRPKDEVFEENGIVFYCIRNVKIKGMSWFFTRKKIEHLINRLYKENKVELIEAPDWTGITSFIRPKKCPIVIKLHGSDTYFCHLDKRPVKWVNRFHEKLALQKANGYVSVSGYTAALTNQLFDMKKEFAIIPNGIDTSLFHPNAKLSGAPTLLYFGTLIRKKGLLELPLIFNRVVEKLPEARLVLIGKDSFDIFSGNSSTWQMMDGLFTKEAKLNTTYIGAVPYEQVRSYIDQASVCVFPTFAEAFPVSWLEAMAMEKAIVASEIGWGKEVIEDGISGFLVHPTEHQEYAEKIVSLLKNPSLALMLGKSARQRVLEQFDMSAIAAQNSTYYSNLLKK